MTKIRVTRAQVAAAQIVAERARAAGREVRPAVLAIAAADRRIEDAPQYASWVRVCDCGHEVDWHRSNQWDDPSWCAWRGCGCRQWVHVRGGNFIGPQPAEETQ